MDNRPFGGGTRLAIHPAMKTTGFLGLMMMFLLALTPLACAGDEASCVDMCEEAQARDCTSIKGNCSDFCAAALNVEEESGCGPEREAYQDCLEAADVCDNACGAREDDYSTCLGNHCLGNMGTPDCKTLINSF
jgi:hypothetical protein